VVDGAGRARLSPWWPAGWWCRLRRMPEPGKVRPSIGPAPHTGVPAVRRRANTAGVVETATASRRALAGGDGCVVGLPLRLRPAIGLPTRSRIKGDAKQAVDVGWRWWSPAQRQRCRDGRIQGRTSPSSIAARTWAPASTDIVSCKAIAGANIFPQPLRRGPRQRRRARSRPRKATNQVRKQPRSNAMLGVDIDYQAIGKREGPCGWSRSPFAQRCTRRRHLGGVGVGADYPHPGRRRAHQHLSGPTARVLHFSPHREPRCDDLPPPSGAAVGPEQGRMLRRRARIAILDRIIIPLRRQVHAVVIPPPEHQNREPTGSGSDACQQ